jgi:hypothetical protein
MGVGQIRLRAKVVRVFSLKWSSSAAGMRDAVESRLLLPYPKFPIRFDTKADHHNMNGSRWLLAWGENSRTLNPNERRLGPLGKLETDAV